MWLGERREDKGTVVAKVRLERTDISVFGLNAADCFLNHNISRSE